MADAARRVAKIERRTVRPTDKIVRRLMAELMHAYNNGYDGIRVHFETMRVTAYREAESRNLDD